MNCIKIQVLLKLIKLLRQMVTTLLIIRYRMSHYNGCVKFDFNNISFQTKIRKAILSGNGLTALCC